MPYEQYRLDEPMDSQCILSPQTNHVEFIPFFNVITNFILLTKDGELELGFYFYFHSTAEGVLLSHTTHEPPKSRTLWNLKERHKEYNILCRLRNPNMRRKKYQLSKNVYSKHHHFPC